jgi:deoxyribodipyrimidine photo-lyase
LHLAASEEPSDVLSDLYPATRGEALARLEGFQQIAGSYGRDRNGVVPGHPNVSRLSAAIRSRLITEEEVLDRVLALHAFPAVEKFVQEVVWRTYWKGWLELRPQVWTTYRDRLQFLRQQAPEPVRRRAEEVAAGRSGVAVMDRFARELLTTGYLHNHARMWWASFWIHVERLPWEWGADFFLRYLLDADPASNTLSWRWVAGLQTPGKVYLVRRSNLERFADPSWLEDTTGLQRLDDSRVQAAVVEDQADTRPRPLLDLPNTFLEGEPRTGLWVHDDDGLLEDSPLQQVRNPVLVSTFGEPDPLDAPGPVVKAWRERARADVIVRTQCHFESTEWESSEIPGPVGGGLARAARQRGCRRVVTLAPSIGPLRDIWASIEQEFERQDVELVALRRPWDSRLWPLADRGFFPFWEKVSHAMGRRSGSGQWLDSLR